MLQLIALFVLVSPAFGQDETPFTLTVMGVPTLNPHDTYKVYVFQSGGTCPEAVAFRSEEEMIAADISAFYSVQPADQVFSGPPMKEIFSIGTYWFNDQARAYEYVLTSCGYDLPRQAEMTYRPVLKQKPSEPPPVDSPLEDSNALWSLSAGPSFTIQDEVTVGGLAQLVWRPLPHWVMLAGGGFQSAAPVLELGVGGGIQADITKTDLVFDGYLAVAGGVAPFRTRCGPENYEPRQVYTCGRQDGFDATFTGPWFGPVASLAMLEAVEAPKRSSKPVWMGGQMRISVPLHLMSNTWPQYQVEHGRTLPVTTTSGQREVRYQWAEDTMFFAEPILTIGLIFIR